MVANRGNGEYFSDDPSSNVAARDYANAMAFARARYTVERAGNQFRPLKAVEMLPALEWEYGITPGPRDTIRQRQATVAAAAKIARGASGENVRTVLTELLGDDFLAYIPTSYLDATLSPGAPEDVGNWVLPGTPGSVYRLIDPVSVIGSPLSVAIELVSGADTPLIKDQKVVLDFEVSHRTEAVTVTVGGATSFQATFSHPHDPGTLLTTKRAPNQYSTKRHNLVLLSASAMADAEKRRKTNLALRKLLRGVSTWSLAEGEAGTAGPFTVGGGKIGRTPIGSVTYT